MSIFPMSGSSSHPNPGNPDPLVRDIDGAGLGLMLLAPPLRAAIAEVCNALDDVKAVEDIRSIRAVLQTTANALSFIDAQPLAVFVNAIGQALDGKQDGDFHANMVSTEKKACVSLLHYLDALTPEPTMHPLPHPLQLFEAYKALLAATKHEKIHPMDLVLPMHISESDLQFSPDEVGTLASSDVVLAACRTDFEGALLSYLRTTDADAHAQLLQRMRDIVRKVIPMQIVSPHRNFWRVIGAAIDVFASGEIEIDSYAKKFLGQINLQLRHLVSGTCEVDAWLLREGLFFIALAPLSNDKARSIKQANSLPDLLQSDYQQVFHFTPEVRHATSSIQRSHEGASAELATALARLEAFIESSVGSKRHPSQIAGAVREFALIADRLNFDGYSALLNDDALGIEKAAGEAVDLESPALQKTIHHLAALSMSLSLSLSLTLTQNCSDKSYRAKHEEHNASAIGKSKFLAPVEQAAENDGVSKTEDATSGDVANATAEEPTEEDFDLELLEIFLTEADDILNTMEKALTASRSAREDMVPVTNLRRGFHTLKGSCRMVGLHAMSGGVMAMEGFLNDWLTEASPGTDTRYALLDYAKREVADWIGEIREHGKSGRRPDAMIAAVERVREKENIEAQQATLQESTQSIHLGDMEISVQLHQIYCAESASLLAVICSHLEQWQCELPDVISPEVLRATHSLKSSSASVQFVALKMPAQALDDVMQFIEHFPDMLHADDCRVLLQVVRQLQCLQQLFASRQMPPVREDLQQQLVALLTNLKARRENASVQKLEQKYDEDGKAPLSQVVVDDLDLCEDACIDLVDPELLEIFLEEGRDLLPQIGASLHQLQKSPDDRRLIQYLLRPLHTIKGSARMAGAVRLGQHMHELETSIDEMVRDGVSSSVRIDDLLARYDYGLQLFEALQESPSTLPSSSSQSLVTDEQPQAMPGPGIVMAGSEAAGVGTAAEVDAGKSVSVAPLVRIRAGILDNLLNQAGEISISRSGLESEVNVLRRHLADLGGNVSRLTTQLRELEIQAEIQIAASNQRLPQNQHFDPLEFDRFTHLQEMTRMLAESVNDVASLQKNLLETVDHTQNSLTQQARLTREMQQELMQARMVQFRGVEERLHRLVRQMAKETGKELELEIQGSTVELDRSILEKMVGPFEHLLRNAAAHGIETAEQRRNAGKPTIGKLSLQVMQDGYEVMIRLSDDGQGLDLARIHEKALRLGLIDVDRQWSDVELKGLIFQPGFTTSADVTAIAGRGVGMDVVRSEVASLGGRISIDTVAGRGATFIIHLPLSLAVTQVVLLELGEQTYAIPSLLVEQVLQLKADRQAEVFRDGSLDWQGRKLPMHYLPVLLGEDKGVPAQQTLSIMVVKSGHDFLAILVDRIIGNREVVTKNIGPQLAHMVGVVGATVLGSGSIALILNPIQLAQRHGYQKVLRQVEPVVPDKGNGKKTILVVDDSLTVRRVMQRLLTREGYHVVLATDGVDALHQLQSIRPDIALVDIEMPRMDGFDLTRNIRDMSGTATLPIIMITSRTAAKHRERAMELGVNEYLGKPYQDDVLLKMIDRLTGGQGKQSPQYGIDEVLFKPADMPAAPEDPLPATD